MCFLGVNFFIHSSFPSLVIMQRNDPVMLLPYCTGFGTFVCNPPILLFNGVFFGEAYDLAPCNESNLNIRVFGLGRRHGQASNLAFTDWHTT